MTITEPVELLERFRQVAAISPEKARASLPSEVAAVLSDGVGFDGGGRRISRMTARQIETVCEGYARELWLWLVGERTWAQCEAGLVGRMTRRAAG